MAATRGFGVLGTFLQTSRTSCKCFRPASHKFQRSLLTTSVNRQASSHTKPEIVVSKDGQMVICYHPSQPFPYEHTKPIPRPDPARPEETHEDVLRRQFVQHLGKERAGPDEEELARMFNTTKHRWFPKNQKVKWMKKNPPRDREGC